MKRTIVFLYFIGCCIVSYSQTQICVDQTFSGTPNGSASNPYRTIQAAVNAANNGDIIQVAKGTYSEAVTIVQKKVQLLGGYAGNGNYTSANPETNKTIIMGSNAAPCILVTIESQAISGSLVISGFTIQDGLCGIKLTGGWSGFLDNITIENNTFLNNGTDGPVGEWGDFQRGGAIGLEGKNVTVKNNIFRNNKSGRGAAIGGNGELTNFLISDNIIENSTAHDDHGGGVYVSGKGTITRNTFIGNTVGAGYAFSYGWGGAVVAFNTKFDTTMVITLSHNVYRNNHAPSSGGAVFVDDGIKVIMENELFYNNTSKETGSAIAVDANFENDPSVLNMYNCTVSGNSSNNSEGTAIYVQGCITRIENCIFWNNGRDYKFLAYGQALARLTINYTLVQQGSSGTGNLTSNPLFANVSNGDFHLQSRGGRYDPDSRQFFIDSAHSPAIDAGNPSSDYSREPLPNGGRVNMGCYGNTVEASKSATSGIEENTQTEWNIYPNPAKENVTIDHLPIGSSIEIIDITGKKVYSSLVKDVQTIISTTDFENGVYILQVTNNGSVSNGKLVVSK